MPSAIIRSRTPASRDAGPIVATILVERITRGIHPGQAVAAAGGCVPRLGEPFSCAWLLGSAPSRKPPACPKLDKLPAEKKSPLLAARLVKFQLPDAGLSA